MASLVALALGTAGCGGGAAPNPSGTPQAQRDTRRAPTDAEQLTALLAKRARAVEEDDAAAFAATASGAQKRRDRRTARNRHGLPLSDFAYAVAQIDTEKGRARLRVQVSYRLRGVTSRFTADRTLTAAKRKGRWRFIAEGGQRDRLPWEIERYRVARSTRFLVLAPDGLDTGSLSGLLDEAYGRIRRRIRGAQLRKRYLAVVARDAAAARRLTSRIRGVETLSAITDAKVQDEGPAKRVSQVISLRLLVVSSALGQLDDDARLRVLSHELTHAALTEETSGRTPAWLSEGVALYVSEDRRVADAARLVAEASSRGERRALTLTALSGPDAIARLSGPAQTAAYAYASAACFYLAAKYGEQKLLRLYDAFNDEELEGEAGAELAGMATHQVLERPLERLERDLRAWILTRAFVGRDEP